jgi:membrane-associated phospholipid phosphatase
MNQFVSTILYYDHICWYYINNQWHTAIMDAVVPYFRNQWFWTPLYLFLALFMPARFGVRGLAWCLFFILCFGLSDQISASLLKPLFHRIRPCNDPELAAYVRILVPCGGGYSFPSSHASNHFALGVFSALTLRRVYPRIVAIPIAWALLVSFSQVYVGVHFPLDVTCGAILGSCIGLWGSKVFNRKFDLTSTVPYRGSGKSAGLNG